MDQLPKEISPNPLVTSSVEVRYQSTLSSPELFPKVYSKLLGMLPLVENHSLPSDIKKQRLELKYAPDYTLSNENYRVSFSNNVILFENPTDYKLWGNYFAFISECLDKFFEIGHISIIERIGVRYASVLNIEIGIENVLAHLPTLTLSGYSQKFEQFRTSISLGDISLLLQIFDNAKITRKELTSSGLYIDIDASHTSENIPLNSIKSKLDTLHTEQKKLFFSLLKPDYIKTLNPKY